MDNSPREQFQSETGRGIDSLVRPSSLFYTVSGHHLDSHKGKYVHEILGCPKPSFRDLPGCTRLSVGVPSQSYRPLDKLNKTMGKSSTSNQAKRHTRGDNKFPPIKVNAKIRHIYSQLTSSEPPTPSQPQGASISTQTEFDAFTEQSDEGTKRDAFTSISPPPMADEAFGMVDTPSSDKLPQIPQSYLSKLEDLEKITGHIVIQRFFTRADEAFGCWLEKQLGMNNKSVGVDTSENTDNIEKPRETTANEGTASDDSVALNAPSTCKPDDAVQCECFIELFTPTEEPKGIESLDSIEQDLLSQCVAFEILEDGSVTNAKKLGSRKGLVQQEKVFEEGEGDNSVQIEETGNKKRLSQASIDREVTHELIKNMDQLISELPSEDYGKIVLVEEEPKKEFKEAVEKVMKNKDSGPLETVPVVPPVADQSEVSSEPVEGAPSDSLLNETETSGTKEDSVIEQPQGEVNEGPVTSTERRCIPDVIDVSELSSSDRFSLESGMSQAESQSKVVEYLGKIDPSAAAAIDEHEEGMDDFLRLRADSSQGEASRQMIHEERKELKRSVSVDSCIGTESSGETKHGLNDSGILLDSGRAVDFDGISETTRSTVAEVAEAEESIQMEQIVTQVQEKTVESRSKSVEESKKDSVEEPSVTRILSNKSVDESVISRSEEQSSTIQRGGSDGDTEDADQSDSDDELSTELSLRRTRRASSSGGGGMPIVAEESEVIVVDDTGEEGEEPLDQFDALIESHEREKRFIRPICRKRNVSTQTTKSVESSLVSSATSRSTTATSSTNSSFDLEFVSKKYMNTVSPDGGSLLVGGDRRRTYLPTGASSLNILNMKFSLGRDFESEFSIRIPNKPSPTGSGCSIKAALHPETTDPSGATPRSSSTVRVDRGTQSSSIRHADSSDLKSLWKDVKSKMEGRVGSESQLFPPVHRERDLLVTGNRMKLISTYDEVLVPPSEANPAERSPAQPTLPPTRLPSSQEHEERIKRSLKRLKKILEA